MATLREHIWFAQSGIHRAKRELLLAHFGSPEEIYAADGLSFAGFQGIGRADIQALLNKSFKEAETVISACEKQGIQILTRQDSAYPQRLLDIGDAPQVLYVRGKLPDIDSVLPIAVVGTRRASEYGLYMSSLIATQLANAGALVVSGMALGIDSAANRAALDVGAATVAVMGCGLDICYPPEEKRLWQRIMEQGAVVSEYAPGTRPYGPNFLERNRIISGLSLGVTLINVSARSGALNTASHAIRQGRELFCVPANVDSNDNEGVTALLKNGAGIVENASDILEGFLPMFPSLNMKAAAFRAAGFRPAKRADSITVRAGNVRSHHAAPPPVTPEIPAERPEPMLEGTQKAIYDTLGREPLHIDKICELTKLDASLVLSEIMLLDLEGHITALPGKFFTKA